MSYQLEKLESYALIGGINSKASPYNNDITEFRDISNMCFFIPGALSKRPGSDAYLGATITGRVHSGFEFTRLNGASCLVAGANTNFYEVTTSWNVERAAVGSGNFDFVAFVNLLFAANGQSFFKYDCSTTENFSVPEGVGFGATANTGGSLSPGITASFYFSFAWMNDRGYIGPPQDPVLVTVNGTAGSNSAQLLRSGSVPTGYGITAAALYRSLPGDTSLFFTTFAPANFTTINDPGFPLSTEPPSTALFFTLAPRYIELYNNQLFMAGFSSLLSTVYWSDIGEPESVQPESFAEIRTNDSDRVTTLKTYNGSLVVCKERSFHRISGDSPENFLIQEISDQYGCLSNRASVVWENYLWFLDPKGIVEYNGANVQVVSTKIEPLFIRMNLLAARDNATAIHYRERNEVWFAIPIDGSSINNCVIVYDYVAKAWTKFEGVDVSCLFLAQGTLPVLTPFFGGYTGTMDYFGSTFLSDRGRPITCSFDTAFYAKGAQTQQALWRRFYLNVIPVTGGASQPIEVDFQQDYGASTVLTRTMYQSPFQSRIDFGISSRAIQAHVEHVSATLSFTVPGFAFEHRFLRNV